MVKLVMIITLRMETDVTLIVLKKICMTVLLFIQTAPQIVSQHVVILNTNLQNQKGVMTETLPLMMDAHLHALLKPLTMDVPTQLGQNQCVINSALMEHIIPLEVNNVMIKMKIMAMDARQPVQ